MKTITVFLIMFCSCFLFAQEIKMYHLNNRMSIQKGKKFDYTYDYEVKEFNAKTLKFNEPDFCNGCKNPDFFAFAPENQWFFAISYEMKKKGEEERKDQYVKMLEEYFVVKKINRSVDKKEEHLFFALESIKERKFEIAKIKIFQKENTYSKYVLIPPNDNFVLLSVSAVDENGNIKENKEIKLSSSCGKLSYTDSSKFRFTFFKSDTQCTIYAKLGTFSDQVEVIQLLNEKGDMPFKFEIIYNHFPIDTINMSYPQFKEKGIELSFVSKGKTEPIWESIDNSIVFKKEKNTVIAIPQKEQKEYVINLIDKNTKLKDTITISTTVTINEEE